MNCFSVYCLICPLNNTPRYVGISKNPERRYLEHINKKEVSHKKSWIDYLNKKKKTKIILYGISMGGTVIMRTVGEDLPNNVICAIEDCGFISNYDQFYNQLSYLKFLPGPIISSSNIIS